ncbi:MAG TPA: tyrosine-type recombinase/integrase [Tepidisphaeraceae bacterium]|nr:tyrosine-type recombinase/integrase [Tepidisphaeraceae bacterium]
MASIVNYDDGLKRIEFSLAPNGPRKVLRLGRVNAKTAESWQAKVETIIADKLANRPHDAEISKWLGELDESMLKRMRAVGLADGVGVTQTTLQGFLDRFFAGLSVKPATVISLGNTRRCLIDYFGADRMLNSITPEQADTWRTWMKDHEKLAEATIARRVEQARQMFKKAMKWKVVQDNPFSEVKAGTQVNKKRMYYVDAETAKKVLDACPNVQWKLIFALSRYGGLRCPSEHLLLKWGHVDFEAGRIWITSPKTEGHVGKEGRFIPMFPELRPLLLEAFEEAEEGSEYVVTIARDAKVNLRTTIQRIMQRAGVTPWPKLFQNLRSSRQTELAQRFPIHVVCAWIGNTRAIAQEHYLQVLDTHFAEALGTPGEAQQKAQQSAAGSQCQHMTPTRSGNEKTPENQGCVTPSQSLVSPVRTREWAVSGSNG